MTRAAAPLDLAEIDLSVAALADAYAEGRFSAEELTRAVLARIAERDPELNAFLFLDPHALDAARAIDAARATGRPLGPLAGIPVAVKDTMDMVGHPTTGGWTRLSSTTGGVDLFPERDSPVVARMRAAGCILLGKTNVPVLSASGTHADDSWAGPTINAFASDFVPGASSSGSATAVAAGFVSLGLAEETGGSIQNPAAAQGLVGLKPTFGLVPNTGILPLATATLDVVGPVARTARDAALALDALAGPHPEDPKTAEAAGRLPPGGYAAALDGARFEGLRLGLWGSGWRRVAGWRGRPLHPAIADAYATAQRRLAAAGATLIDDPFAGSGFADLAETAGGLEDYDLRGLEGLPNDLDRYLRRLGPQAAIRDFAALERHVAADDPFAPGAVLGYLGRLPAFRTSRADPTATPDRRDFEALRARYREIFDAVFARERLDALVFPQMADPLPRRGASEAIRETTVCEINIAGLPGLTVPAGRLASGEPFALIFVGPAWSEARLLRLAAAWEHETARRPFRPA